MAPRTNLGKQSCTEHARNDRAREANNGNPDYHTQTILMSTWCAAVEHGSRKMKRYLG